LAKISNDVSGLILAGGRASRMGGADKGLIIFKGVTVAEQIARQLASQCGSVAINANRNRHHYAQLGYPVIVAPDYVSRMLETVRRQQCPLAVASCDGRLQPVYAMIDTSLRQSLDGFLRGNERKIELWYRQHNFAEVDFSDYPQMFENFNTPEQLREME
jgi:molybdopterin-guanine dinucleotide biosynthesis protein A